jgi:hypothetical protein
MKKGDKQDEKISFEAQATKNIQKRGVKVRTGLRQ